MESLISDRVPIGTCLQIHQLEVVDRTMQKRQKTDCHRKLIKFRQKEMFVVEIPTGRQIFLLFVEISVRDVEDQIATRLEYSPPIFQGNSRVDHMLKGM